MLPSLRLAAVLLFLASPIMASTVDLRSDTDDGGMSRTINDNFRRLSAELNQVKNSVSDLETGSTTGGSFAAINRIINGGFVFNQRVLSEISDDTYHLDRWYALTQTASMTVTQQTLQEDGQPTNLRMTQPGASAQRIGTAQIIEASNIQDLRGQEVTLSARVRCSASQAIRVAILEHTGTADSATSDVVSDWTSASYTAGGFFIGGITVTVVGSTTPASNTWTDIEVTGTLSSGANNVIVVFWTEATLAQNATLDLGLVQLERGDTATEFALRPYTTEYSLCMRYFQKSYELGVGTGTATTDGNITTRRTITNESSTFFNHTFVVPMRTTPTVVWYSPSSGTANRIHNVATGAITVTGTNTDDPTTAKRPGAPDHGANGSAGHIIIGHFSASAEL